MSRYIDEVIAAEKISEKHNIPLSELVDTFAEIPSSDVVEVKRAEWKVDETHDYEPYCSLCGHEPIAGEKYNYCPDCGADMRGDKR